MTVDRKCRRRSTLLVVITSILFYFIFQKQNEEPWCLDHCFGRATLLLHDLIWFIAQMIHSIDENNNKMAMVLEEWSLNHYANIHYNSTSHQSNIIPIQTLRLSCDDSTAYSTTTGSTTSEGSRTTTPKTANRKTNYCIDWEETDITHIKSSQQLRGLDFRQPILIPNLGSYHSNTTKPLSLSKLSISPIGDLDIQYFSDATKVGALKPNSIAPLKEIIYNISMHLNSTIKIGTQRPIEAYPSLIEQVAPHKIVTTLFGDQFKPEDVTKPYMRYFPPLTTVPIFLARGLSRNNNNNDHNNDDDDDDDDDLRGDKKKIYNNNDIFKNVRTDLHCEPIGNVAMQLEGSKKWTLVDAKYSRSLQPTISKHGRGFFYSKLNPLNRHYLDNDSVADTGTSIPHYEIITNKGDALWVPPWTWHRIDYIPDTVSLAASLFHFRPSDFIINNPWFAIEIIPNLVKELFGWKTE